MGANEHGVVIGNEGVQARSPPPQENALIGMDLIRLALERAVTATEALSIITSLLEQYGQGGNCGHLTPAYYNNSFLIADRTDAFVLDTVGREWIVERIVDIRSLSNTYSIGRNVEAVSAGLPALIRSSGWSEETRLGYCEVIADPQTEHIGHSGMRRERSLSLLSLRAGRLTAADMMRILRDHGADEVPPGGWYPEHEIKRTICIHACAENFPAQTAGSLVSELHPTDAVHWVTGTAAPCTSVFKPVLLDVTLPVLGSLPTDRFDPRTLWWRHERMHRAALLTDFAKFIEDIRSERDALEASFDVRMKAVLNGGSAADRARVVAECWSQALDAEDRWFARMNRTAATEETPYRTAWLKMNQIAGLEATH
jgi:dipeptidase